MTGEPTVLRAGGLVLRLDGAGTVVTAASPGPAGVSWLTGCGALTVTAGDGSPVVLGAAQVAVDVDEVEVERSGGGLRTVVRHSVEQAWTVRVVLANESAATLTLEQVRVGWGAAPGTVVTALAAGARATYAVQPATGEGPVLVGRLRSGAQHGVDADGLLLGPLVLPPHTRWAVQWRWEVVPDVPRAAAGTDLPRTTWFDLGQSVALPGGPDVAVVATGLVVELEDDRVEVAATEPGAYAVELRSARGTAAYAMTWAPDLDALVDADAQALLAGPTSPAGTVRLDGAAAGLVVQDALARRTVGSPDELSDALELVAGELVAALDEADPAATVDPLTLAFLAREADRSAGAGLLDAAVSCLLATTTPEPGLGLAGVGLALARVRAGRGATELVAHLAGLQAASAAPDARLEIALLLRPRDAEADEGVLAALRRLGAALGAGLPGRVVPGAEPERVAYASTLLALVDEPTGQRLRHRWGITASELARRTAAEARARVATRDDGPVGRRALAWLVLGRR